MTLQALLGADLWPLIILTGVLFGGVALMTGQSLAQGWKPFWTVPAYGLLIGVFDRFLHYAMFDGALWHLWGYLLHTAFLTAVAAFAYMTVRARKMVQQYPWRYVRAGLFGWREIGT